MKNILQFLIPVLMSVISLFSFQIPVHSQFPAYPETRLLVFSDPHYFDPSLGTDGKAFQTYLDNDRKLLRDSKVLMETVISEIEKSDAGIVLIPGDLTKDGEKINHEIMAEYFRTIEKSGKKVFVIPGNHDISNPEAFKYSGDQKERVPTVSPDEFASIYSDFGYGDALMRDKNSLSYVSEPLEDLWILGLDACRYKENHPEGHSVTSGKFSKETLAWLEGVLQEARSNNKAVITMLHHGVLEHYKKQKKLYGEYVVDDYKKVSSLLAKYGARVAFTGHFHAQDITMKKFRNHNFVIDIETGSLVTYPCPYRLISISADQTLKVSSGFINSISGHEDYTGYAKEYVHNGISGIAANTLIGMGVDSTESWSLSGQVADAFLAHYKGDEITPEQAFNMYGISMKGKFLIGFKKNLVKSLHKDLYPSDNELEISLKSIP